MNRVSHDDGFENHFVSLTHADVYCIGVAEEVVQITQDLLIRADQESAEVVFRAAGEYLAAPREDPDGGEPRRLPARDTRT